MQEGGATLLPIDSEHSAIFQCLPPDRASWAERIDHIVLTASGGPFRERDPSSLDRVTPDEACAHPNWVMGRKISVDSATMMNKALEVIEAHWLFALQPEQIRVVIHPQSIVHSMVVCRDQSVLAQLGTPDMKVPIACGLAWPERFDSGASRLDFTTVGALTFERTRCTALSRPEAGLRLLEGSARSDQRAERGQRNRGCGVPGGCHSVRLISTPSTPPRSSRWPGTSARKTRWTTCLRSMSVRDRRAAAVRRDDNPHAHCVAAKGASVSWDGRRH